ncbi:hypothetical protein ACF0H5_024285 [Mactra antiquata]
MASLGKIEIYLGNSMDEVFRAGQTVYGKLVVTVWKSMKIQGPEIEIPNIQLLESGKHVFNYKFDLPLDIPSTFEGSHGYVRYWVKGKVHGLTGLLDQSGKVEFIVERTLDLNTVPRALESAEDEDACVICGGCWSQGTITASFRINRRGFVSGESIVCDAEIYNGSVSSIKSTEITFYKLITYGDDTFMSRTREKQTICEQFRGKIKSGNDEIYDQETLTLPSSLPATSLPGCSLIDIDYVVELRVHCPKQRINMKLPLLIIVGTVALKEVSNSNNQPIRDIDTNNRALSDHSPIINPHSDWVFPWLQDSNEMNNYVDSYGMSSSSNVPPMATELNEMYPPIADVSIQQRERTLASIYNDIKRPRLMRIMTAVNEGVEIDEEDSV